MKAQKLLLLVIELCYNHSMKHDMFFVESKSGRNTYLYLSQYYIEIGLILKWLNTNEWLNDFEIVQKICSVKSHKPWLENNDNLASINSRSNVQCHEIGNYI